MFEQVAIDVLMLADDAAEVLDAYVTLCVHAGIAAADVICAARTGTYSRSGNHADAVSLLRTVDKESAGHLEALLKVKTLAGYSQHPISADRSRRAGRAMSALLVTARSLPNR
ncbi:hypothetical protein [Cellulomonas hominis]